MTRELRPILVARLLVVALLVGAVQSSVGVGLAQQTATPEDVERAHERLQQANRAYQTALATVDAARDAGVDTREFDGRLAEAHAALITGVEAVQRTPPNTDRAIEAAVRAELLALAVETDAAEAATRAIAETTVDAETVRLANGDTAAATDVWLRRARADLAASQFEAVERDLLYAQHAAQQTQYEAYLANLSAQGVELDALEAEVAGFAASLDEGALTPSDATRLRRSFVRANTCVERLYEATLAIERANRSSSVLVTADVTAATVARQQGYDALERGEYDAACEYADTATETADAETRRVRTTLDSDVVARAADVVYDVLRGVVATFDGRDAAPDSVRPPTLTLVDVRPVSVAFPPPEPTVTPLDFTSDTVDVPTPPSTDAAARPPDDTQPSADRVTSTVESLADDDEEQVRFAVRIDRVEECGATCRDVTATLRNVGTGDAHNVEADIELSVGKTVVWTGTESIGTVPAGETRSVSQRITLSFGEALQARSSGSVDVVLVVRSDEHTQTVRDTIPI